ncbi:MAG: DNA-methyltransferase, partial [Anaerolineae bacterium]
PPSPEAKEQSRLSIEEWNAYFRGHWVFPGEKQTKHLAMFPEELPRRLILLYTNVGDVVLDPFMGSGTTAVTAKKLRRHYIGYELSPEYCRLAEERLLATPEPLIPFEEAEPAEQEEAADQQGFCQLSAWE